MAENAGSPASPQLSPEDENLDAVITRITQFPFRAKFHLRERELNYLVLKGFPTIRKHAADFVAQRLAPAQPARDGRQTPWGGHPVFRAQHATATCCRGCLERNHGLEKGRELSVDEQRYVAAVIVRWIERDAAQRGFLRSPGPRRTPPTTPNPDKAAGEQLRLI